MPGWGRRALKAPEVPAPAMFLRSILSEAGHTLAIPQGHPHCPTRKGKAMASPREKDAGVRLDEWSPRLLKSRLYQRILVDIIIGALAPGEQLDENHLARRYGGGLAGICEGVAPPGLEGVGVCRARGGASVGALGLVGGRGAF